MAWTSVSTGTLARRRRVRGAGGWAEVASGEDRRSAGSRRSLPRARRASVIAALRAAHPATEVAFDVYEMAAWSGPARDRPGRAAVALRRRCASSRCSSPRRCRPRTRVCGSPGDPTAEVSRVAVCGGAGDTLFDAVRACGADVYVTADLRHHPASEQRENAGDGPPYLVDVAHWSSEWPWLAGVANRLQGALEAAGTPIEVHVSAKCTDPWTFRVPSPGGVVR